MVMSNEQFIGILFILLLFMFWIYIIFKSKKKNIKAKELDLTTKPQVNECGAGV